MSIIVAFAFLSTTTAFTFIAHQYSAIDCQGAPNLIMSFNVSDPNAWELPTGSPEYWPDFYYFMCPVYPYTKCSSSLVPIDNACCYSIIKDSPIPATYNYSFSGVFLTDKEYEEYELSSVKSEFCYLETVDGGNPPGFNYIYILGNGQCIEKNFSCYKGQLVYYPEVGCKGKPTEFNLNQEMKNIEIPDYATVNAKFGIYPYRMVKVGFIEHQPQSYLIPTHETPFEVIALIVFILTLIAMVCGIVYWSLEYKKRTAKQFFMFLATPISVVMFIIGRLVYIYTVFEDGKALNWAWSAKEWTFYLSTLISACSTILLIENVANLTKRQFILAIGAILIIHVSLVGSSYAETALYDGYDNVPNFIKQWEYIRPLWTIFIFIWSTVPIAAIVRMITSYAGKSLSSKITAAYILDPYFFPLLGVQLLGLLLYALLSIIKIYTNWLYSDRNAQSLDSIVVAIISINCLVNSLLIERVKRMFIKARPYLEKFNKNSLRLTTIGVKSTNTVTRIIPTNRSTKFPGNEDDSIVQYK